MPYDLPEPELERYVSTAYRPPDFDDFWHRTLRGADAHDLAVRLTRQSGPLDLIDVYDVQFAGYGGQAVRGWLRVPKGKLRGLRTLVEFVGYGGGRGLAEDSLFWAACGYAHLVMDTRAQGSNWRTGDTGDDAWIGPHYPGWLTQGLESEDTYYYRRVFTDAVRAVQAAVEALTPADIVAVGTSQGGGIALAATALSPHVSAAAVNLPFLCDIAHAVTVTDGEPYAELRRYLAIHRNREAAALRTISYFDGVNFASQITVPIRFTVGLLDQVCPALTIYGAYNACASAEKILDVHHFGEHEHMTTDDVSIARWLGDLPRS